MAQDSNLRHLRADPHPRESGSASSDPLAELARLIGQNDPFADPNSRDARAPARPAAAPQEAPEWLARPSGSAPQGGPDAGSYDPGGYPDPNYAYQDDPRYQDPRYLADDQGAYTTEGNPEDPAAYGYQSGAYYDDQQGYDDGAYEAPPEKRRGGLMTVAAVVALAVFGTAAALGYRAWTGPSSTGGEPPVIKAEQTPTKVVPAAPSNDGQLARQPYQRADDRGGAQFVQREETPIDPRSAVPRPPAPASQNVLPPLGATASVPAPAGDAKRVSTITIRPDQAGIAAAQPQAAPQPPAARPQVAAVPPPAPVRVPTQPIQSAPSRQAAGSYVQVSSQLTEENARESFRVLQSKYPGQLGDQRVTIQRADLTAHGKGIVYRAMVGPFASRDEANQLCKDLEKAGGKCVLHTPQ